MNICGSLENMALMNVVPDRSWPKINKLRRGGCRFGIGEPVGVFFVVYVENVVGEFSAIMLFTKEVDFSNCCKRE